jgi:hypothetical protein
LVLASALQVAKSAKMSGFINTYINVPCAACCRRATRKCLLAASD